jgi:hypothetical protein
VPTTDTIMTCPGRNRARHRLISFRHNSGGLDGIPIDPAAVATNGADGTASVAGRGVAAGLRARSTMSSTKSQFGTG